MSDDEIHDRWTFTFEIDLPLRVDPATLAGQMGFAAHQAGGRVVSARGDQQRPTPPPTPAEPARARWWRR